MASLRIINGTIDAANTAVLRRSKLYARSNGSFHEAILSAGYQAKKQNKMMFVYSGNSYGHGVWRVSYKPSEYLNTVNNTGAVIFSVDPELTLRRHEMERSTANPRETKMAKRKVGPDTTVYVASAWFRENDPFVSVVALTAKKCESVIRVVTREEARTAWQGETFGTLREALNDIAWSGVFPEKLSTVASDREMDQAIYELERDGVWFPER